MTFTHKVGPSFGVTFRRTEQLEALDELELLELRRTQVVYIDWCGERMDWSGDAAEWQAKIAYASRMTTRIDIALSKLRDW